MTNRSNWRSAWALFLFCAAGPVSACAQTFTTLLDFGVSTPFPSAGLVQGAAGDLYGATATTFFKLSSDGSLTTLNNYTTSEALILGTDGNFYGTTESGGVNGRGSVFQMTPSGALTTVYSFGGPDGESPLAPLIQAADGRFYGTTHNGGTASCPHSSCGTVFRLSDAGKLTTLHNFPQTSGDGRYPYGGLVQGTDGNFYGTTYAGGTYNRGTVFRITPTGVLTILRSFRGSDGEGPEASLIQGTDGGIYGTTFYGGTYNVGTVFKITVGGKFITLHSFDGTDGTFPSSGGLVEATDGSFYGTTYNGGNLSCIVSGGVGCGTLFSVSSAGVFVLLHAMSFGDGANPSWGLLQSTSGVFYGTAVFGGLPDCDGSFGCGTLYSLDMGLGPFVAFVRSQGHIGQGFGILGQGFTGTTGVSLNGIPVKFIVTSDTLLKATIPLGASTGYVTVTTPSGTLTSNVPFHVLP